VSSNIIFANAAEDTDGLISNEQGGGLIIRGGQIDLDNNVFAENYAAASGGAVFIAAAGRVSKNSFVRNDARQTIRFTNDLLISGNTIFSNNAQSSIMVVPSQASAVPVINNNNIFNNGPAWALVNNTVTTLNAQSNWWGSVDTGEIEFNLDGMVDYSNFVAVPFEDTPLTPPQVADFSYSEDSAALTWEPNPEADVAGYKVYFGVAPAPNFTDVMDVGMVTSVTLPDVPDQGLYVAVTAYDSGVGSDSPDTPVNEDQINGYESWYSEQNYVPAKTTPSGGGGGGSLGWLGAFMLLYYLYSKRRRGRAFSY
jgi:hypothetical protein